MANNKNITQLLRRWSDRNHFFALSSRLMRRILVDHANAKRAEQEREANEKVRNVRAVSASRDHIFGNPVAKITLIEYSDFECPYCKRLHATPKGVVESYDGRVNRVYRRYPLSFHDPGATRQAEASECAAEFRGNDAFWAYTDAIYSRTTSNGKGFSLDKLVPLAEE